MSADDTKSPEKIRRRSGNPHPIPGPGRPKGCKNKVTKTVKEAVLKCFDRLGGAEWLYQVAQDDPKTFVQLLAKCVPNEVTGKDGAPLVPACERQVLVVPITAPTTGEWTAAVSAIAKGDKCA